MVMHERFMKVQQASVHIQSELTKAFIDAELTPVESLQVLNEAIAGTLKYMLREERHPDDPTKPADRA